MSTPSHPIDQLLELAEPLARTLVAQVTTTPLPEAVGTESAGVFRTLVLARSLTLLGKELAFPFYSLRDVFFNAALRAYTKERAGLRDHIHQDTPRTRASQLYEASTLARALLTVTGEEAPNFATGITALTTAIVTYSRYNNFPRQDLLDYLKKAWVSQAQAGIGSSPAKEVPDGSNRK